jgi:hypothetical protein
MLFYHLKNLGVGSIKKYQPISKLDLDPTIISIELGGSLNNYIESQNTGFTLALLSSTKLAISNNGAGFVGNIYGLVYNHYR